MGDVRSLRPETAERDDSAGAIHRYSKALIFEAQASVLDAAARGLETHPDTPTTTGEVAEALHAQANDLRDGIR